MNRARSRREQAGIPTLALILGVVLAMPRGADARAEETPVAEWEPDLESALHRYFERSPRDRCSRRIADLSEGRLPLDRSSERAFFSRSSAV